MAVALTSPLLTTSLIQGCGGSDTKNDTLPKEDKTIEQAIIESVLSGDSESFFGDFAWDFGSSIVDWWNDDGEEEQVLALTDQLSNLATSASSVTEFTHQGLKLTVEYVVKEYFPIAETYLLDNDWGDNNNQYLYESLIDSSASLVSYMADFYNDANSSFFSAPANRAVAIEDERTLVQKIIDEIYNIIAQMMLDFFTFGTDNIVVPDPNDNAAKIDPNQTFSFVEADIAGDVYYVASEQYMTVTFANDGLSGYGDIGYGVGADFSSSVSAGELFIDMDGVYEVAMKYKDPGYCIATQMRDTSDGSTYPAFWFSDLAVYDKATNLTTAESLCYIHSTEYEAKVIAKDGVLEPIPDSRDSHTPVATAATSSMVSTLINGVDNTATVTDAKYFARKMRHGIFSIYTTNGQTHTLQATETEKVTRELLPLVASSAISIDEMLTGAYDASIAFQEEVSNGLNEPIGDVNSRVDALIAATSQAMDRTVSPDYHGVSDVTLYGDVVEFTTVNKDINLWKNLAKADVIITVTNPSNKDQRTANIKFITPVKTTVIGNAPVEFSEINAVDGAGYIGRGDYKLTVKSMKYIRADGLMQLTGDGYLGATSKMMLSNYEVLANFTENPVELQKFTVTADGTITTPSARKFDGTLVFDGNNANNSQMNGTLVGINEEPTIKGTIQTSLSSEDITAWVGNHDSVSASDAGDLDNIGNQSYSMNVEITQPGKTVKADMLVKCDDVEKTWTYIMKNLAVSDANLNLRTQSVYLVQNGDNTLVETFEKLALNGLGLDSDINALVNFGWDVASDFSKIGIKGLTVTMKPASGDVAINTTINVLNDGNAMSADMSSSYDYATTHLTSAGDFATLVDASSGKNVYDNSFTTHGVIKVDNKYNYLYALAYTDATQDMLFTSKDSSYQMGFRMTDTLISGGDSYGILATFKMNDTYDVMERMELRNRENNPLGIYIRSEDKLKVKFADKVAEYMYLY